MMKKPFKIEDISTYRSELMGWAILWIMMLHFTFTQIKPLGFLAQFGYAGVEIFMLVSGFGLFFSLDKDRDITKFYKKRLLRIFPTYYILGVFASILLYHDNIVTYLFRYSTIGFWTGGAYGEWYIPSIVLLYIVAPFLKKLFDKKLSKVIIFICSLCILASFIIVKSNIITKGEPHFFLLYRVPAFIFGMACAYWIKEKSSSKYYYLILLVGIPFFALLFPLHHDIYNFKYLSVFFLLPLFTICFILISKLAKWFNPIIGAIGRSSLEVYIIQGMFFHAIVTGILSIPVEYHDAISILLIILSSCLGIMTHWLIGKTGINRFLRT